MAVARPFTGLPTRHADRNTIMTDTTNIITTGTGKEGLWPGGTFYPAQQITPDALIFSQTSVGGSISGDGPVAHIPYIKDGLDAAIVAEGTKIAETDPDMIDAGDINETTGLTPLLDAIGKVGDNGGSPTGIIMGYGTWANLHKLNDKNNRPLIATDVANSPTPAIYGIPIILNMQTPAGTILLNDSSQVLSAVSQAAIACSDQAYFANDSIALRVTMRPGFGVLRPNRLARLSVNKATGK